MEDSSLRLEVKTRHSQDIQTSFNITSSVLRNMNYDLRMPETVYTKILTYTPSPKARVAQIHQVEGKNKGNISITSTLDHLTVISPMKQPEQTGEIQ